MFASVFASRMNEKLPLAFLSLLDRDSQCDEDEERVNSTKDDCCLGLLMWLNIPGFIERIKARGGKRMM